MQTSERSIATQLIWRNRNICQYIDSCFIKPQGVVFAAIDSHHDIKLFDTVSKELVICDTFNKEFQ